MPKKIMQFFKKPSSILAILLAVALLGTGSLYALKAFAYGEIDVIPAELLSENFDVVTVDHVFVYNNESTNIQIYCSVPGVGTRTVMYTGGSSDFETNCLCDEDGYNICLGEYESYAVRFTGEILSKTCYVYQTFEKGGKTVSCYMGSFDVADLSGVRNVTSPFDSSSLSLSGGDTGHTFAPSSSFEMYGTNAGEFVYYDANGDSVAEDNAWVRKEWVSDEDAIDHENIALIAAADADWSNNYELTYTGEVVYKYGPARDVDSGYVSNLQVLVPKNDSAHAYISSANHNESTIAGNSDYRTGYIIQSLADLTHIDDITGTVITFYSDYGNSYLPMKVDVKYDNSGWKSKAHVFVKDNGISDGEIQNVYDNTENNNTVDFDGINQEVEFLPQSGEIVPQMYYDEGGTLTSIDGVPSAYWSDGELTQNTVIAIQKKYKAVDKGGKIEA